MNTMNTTAMVVKAMCRQIEERYGSNKAAAAAAGCSPGVWSCYCSDEHPESNLPLYRVKTLCNQAERQAFADLIMGDTEDTAEDVLSAACTAVSDVAEVLLRAKEAAKDGRISRREAKEIMDGATQGIATLTGLACAADKAANAA